MFFNLTLVLTGGGLGSCCRYLFSLITARWFGTGFSWGTLGVNLIGCLLIGVTFSLAERSSISPTMRLLFMTGFLGGLSTFSSYALESACYLGGGGLGQAVINIALNNIGGFILVFLGIALGRSL